MEADLVTSCYLLQAGCPPSSSSPLQGRWFYVHLIITHFLVLVAESFLSPIRFSEKHHSRPSAENVFPCLPSLHSTLPLIDALISSRALQYSTPVLCEVILPRHVWLRVKCPPLRARTAAPGRQHHEYIIIPISILLPRQHFWSGWVIKSYITNTLI